VSHRSLSHLNSIETKSREEPQIDRVFTYGKALCASLERRNSQMERSFETSKSLKTPSSAGSRHKIP